MSNEHKERGERLKALIDDQISETLGKLIDTDQAGTDRLLNDLQAMPSEDEDPERFDGMG